MNDHDPASVLDLSVVEALRDLEGEGGVDLFEELVTLFVEDAARLLGEMEAALSTGDARTLERSAHTLKSSSASLGAIHLSETCYELEQLVRSGGFDAAGGLVSRTSEAYRDACQALRSLRA